MFARHHQSGQINAGLEGDLNLIGQDWHWDVNYVYGAALFSHPRQRTNNERFYNAIDAVKDSNGKIVCRVTLTDRPGCQAAYRWTSWARALSRKRRSTIPVAMRVIRPTTRPRSSGQFPWTLIDLPAGPLTFAMGGENRFTSLNQTSNSDPAKASLVNYAGTYVPRDSSGNAIA